MGAGSGGCAAGTRTAAGAVAGGRRPSARFATLSPRSESCDLRASKRPSTSGPCGTEGAKSVAALPATGVGGGGGGGRAAEEGRRGLRLRQIRRRGARALERLARLVHQPREVRVARRGVAVGGVLVVLWIGRRGRRRLGERAEPRALEARVLEALSEARQCLFLLDEVLREVLFRPLSLRR